jgi:hypothetical protein
MPTRDVLASFWRDWERLTPEQQRAFKTALQKFVADLRAGRFRSGLRVKHVQGTDGIFELTWANDGRATFQYGDEVKAGEAHIIWRRVGTHDILNEP